MADSDANIGAWRASLMGQFLTGGYNGASALLRDEVKASSIVAHVMGNLISVAIMILLYCNYLLFQEYFTSMAWAWLLSEALRPLKTCIVVEIEWLSQPSNVENHRVAVVILRRWTLFGEPLRSCISSLCDNFLPLSSAVAGIAVVMHYLPWQISLAGFILVLLLFLLTYLLDQFVLRFIKYLGVDQVVSFVVISVILFVISAMTLFLSAELVSESVSLAEGTKEWIETNVMYSEDAQRIWDVQGEQFLFKDQVAVGMQLAEEWSNKLDDMLHDENSSFPPLLRRVVLMAQNVTRQTANGNQTLAHTLFQTALFHSGRKNASLGMIASELYGSVRDTGLDISTTLKALIQKPFDFVAVVLQYVLWMTMSSFSAVFGTVTSVFDAGFRVFLFFGVLFYTLSSRKGRLQQVFEVISPIPDNRKKEMSDALTNAVREVFIMPARKGILHGLCTWVLCFAFNIPLMAFATFVSFFLAIFPFIPPYVALSPWAIVPWLMWFYGSSPSLSAQVVKPVLWLVIQTYVFGRVNSNALKGMSTPPFYTGLSIVFGLISFGFQGVLLGPLLLALVNVVDKFCQSPKSDASTGKKRKKGRRSHRSLSTATQ